MNILIIEDEAPAARRLQQLLAQCNASITIQGVLESIGATLKWFRNNEMPELIFMDIQLADGISFDLFKQMEIKTPVIFTTAYDAYALQAFKVNSIDYLLKPIEKEALADSLHKYHQIKEQFTETDSRLFQTMLQVMNQKKKLYKSRFLVKLGDRLLFIFTQQIAYFMAEEKLVFIISTDNKKYAVDYSLDELETLLPPADFFRINRQFITHIQAIRNIHHYFNGKLKLTLYPAPTQEVIVSRERTSEVKQWLDQ